MTLHQPAAAPRHLLDRGPRPADRRPAGDQPGGPDRRQARRVARRRDDRRRRRQGRRELRPPLGPRGRDRRVAAVVDQARRRAVGARPRRGPPDAAPQRPPRPGRAPDRRRPADRPRPARRRAPRRGGVRVRDVDARRDRLRHGPPVPPRHLPDRDRDPARGPPGEVRRDAGAGRAVRHWPSPRTSGASSPRVGARDRSARSSARAAGCSAPARGRRAGTLDLGAGRRRAALGRVAAPGAPSPAGGRPRRPPPAGVAARGPPRRRARRPGRLLGRRARARRRPIDRSGRRCRARSSAASCAARSASSCAARPASRSARSPGPALDLRLVGQANDYVGKGLSGGRLVVAPGAGSRGRPEPPGDRRQHLPVRRDRRPAPPRRPGRDAVRRPQFRRAGRRRGPRPARLRVHDRRRRRRPRPDRGELRGRDDRRPGLPARPGRPPPGGARLAERRRDAALVGRAATARTARALVAEFRGLVEAHRDAGSELAARLLAERHELEDDIWLVEPIVGRGAGRRNRAIRVPVEAPRAVPRAAVV